MSVGLSGLHLPHASAENFGKALGILKPAARLQTESFRNSAPSWYRATYAAQVSPHAFVSKDVKSDQSVNAPPTSKRFVGARPLGMAMASPLLVANFEGDFVQLWTMDDGQWLASGLQLL